MSLIASPPAGICRGLWRMESNSWWCWDFRPSTSFQSHPSPPVLVALHYSLHHTLSQHTSTSHHLASSGWKPCPLTLHSLMPPINFSLSSLLLWIRFAALGCFSVQNEINEKQVITVTWVSRSRSRSNFRTEVFGCLVIFPNRESNSKDPLLQIPLFTK